MPPIENDPNHVPSHFYTSVTSGPFGSQGDGCNSTPLGTGNFGGHAVTGSSVSLPSVKSLMKEVDITHGRYPPTDTQAIFASAAQALPLTATPFNNLQASFYSQATPLPAAMNLAKPQAETNVSTRPPTATSTGWFMIKPKPHHGEYNNQCHNLRSNTESSTTYACGKKDDRTIALTDKNLIDGYGSWLRETLAVYGESLKPIIMFAEYLCRYHATSLSDYQIPQGRISEHSDEKIENFHLAPYPEFKKKLFRNKLPEALTRFREYRESLSQSGQPIFVSPSAQYHFAPRTTYSTGVLNAGFEHTGSSISVYATNPIGGLTPSLTAWPEPLWHVPPTASFSRSSASIHGTNNNQPLQPRAGNFLQSLKHRGETIAVSDQTLIETYVASLGYEGITSKLIKPMVMFAAYLYRYHGTSLRAYQIPQGSICSHSDAKIENFLRANYEEFRGQPYRKCLPEALTRFRQFLEENSAKHAVESNSNNHSIFVRHETHPAPDQNRPGYYLPPNRTRLNHQRLNPQSSVTFNMTSLQSRQVAQDDIAELQGFSVWLNRMSPQRRVPVSNLGMEQAILAYAEYLARYHGQTLAQQVLPSDKAITEAFDPRIENFRVAGYPGIGANEVEYIVQGLNMLALYRKESGQTSAPAPWNSGHGAYRNW